jgi:hypothetical protein
MTGSVYIDRTSEHRVRFSVPGAVEDHRTSLGAGGNRVWIQDITDHHFDRKTRDRVGARGPSNEHPNLGTTLEDQTFDKPPTDASRRANDKHARAEKSRCQGASPKRSVYKFFHLS